MKNTIIQTLLIALCLASCGSAFALNGEVRCPVVSDTQSGLFSKAKLKYRCFRSARHAKLAGFGRFSINSVNNNSHSPTPTPNPQCPTLPPTPIPNLKSFSQSGMGSGATQTFTVTSLPATVAYVTQGGKYDRFSLILRDKNSGYMISQIAFGSGILNNTAVISKTGIFYLEVKASDNMAWGLTVSYK